MPKTDKELAVELACAYVQQLANMKDENMPSLSEIKSFLNACYQVISELPDDSH